MSATHIANLFMEQWLISYGITSYLQTDNGTQFVNRFFAIVRALPGGKHLTTRAYHLHTNGQYERFKETIFTRLRHNVGEHRREWNIFVRRLTYAYDTKIHRSRNQTSFNFVLSQHPSRTTLQKARSARPTDGYAETSLQVL